MRIMQALFLLLAAISISSVSADISFADREMGLSFSYPEQVSINITRSPYDHSYIQKIDFFIEEKHIATLYIEAEAGWASEEVHSEAVLNTYKSMVGDFLIASSSNRIVNSSGTSFSHNRLEYEINWHGFMDIYLHMRSEGMGLPMGSDQKRTIQNQVLYFVIFRRSEDLAPANYMNQVIETFQSNLGL